MTRILTVNRCDEFFVETGTFVIWQNIADATSKLIYAVNT